MIIKSPLKINRKKSTVTNIRGEKLPKSQFINLGEIKKDITPDIPERFNESSAVWTGAISLANRFKNGELHGATVARALKPETLETYYVKVAASAQTRCIDGRIIAHYAQPEAPANRPLGPQMPGGTPAAALCRRIAGWGSFATDDFTISSDIASLAKLFSRIGYTAGGHIDDHAPEGMTGCGAIDKIPDIMQRITSPIAQEQLRGIAQQLLGSMYDREVTDAIMGRFLSLGGKSATYFTVDAKGRYQYRQAVLKSLRKENPTGVEKLVGAHQEVALVINTMPGTTFQRDQFALDFNPIQVFNYDFWSSVELAQKLFPLHRISSAKKRRTIQRLRQRFLITRALFGVATAMVLTDGTIKLIVRKAAQ